MLSCYFCLYYDFISTCFYYSKLASAIKILEMMKFAFDWLHGVVKWRGEGREGWS